MKLFMEFFLNSISLMEGRSITVTKSIIQILEISNSVFSTAFTPPKAPSPISMVASFPLLIILKVLLRVKVFEPITIEVNF